LEYVCEYVIENHCELTFQDGKVEGDVQSLVTFIFNQFKKQFKFINLILPKGFRFHLNKQQFEVRQPTKTSLARNRAASKVEPTSVADHHYVHRDLLSSLL
jgi:hypothetical protein